MTQKQKNDIELAKYFIPKSISHIKITPEDERLYLEYSEQGKHKDLIKQSHFTDGFNALVSGKQWRGRTVHELWEQGILDGSVPYSVLLEGLPELVVDFMKKEMFKGDDADLIERVYREIKKI